MNVSRPFDYVALSHCWGDENTVPPTRFHRALESQPQQPSHYFYFTNFSKNKKPTGADIEEFVDWEKPISANKFTKTIEEAISIVRGIGYRYLWIDSLCVIQNCEVDIKEELKNMGLVYANAIFTLSATASANAASCCIFKNDIFLGNCSLRKEEYKSLVATFPGREETPLAKLFSEKVEQAPLTSRGWTFQERVLASRVLHFCKGAVLFECNKIQASSCHGNDTPYPRKIHVQADGKLLRSLGPPRSDPPPIPPRPTIALPNLPNLSFSLPSFSFPPLPSPSEYTQREVSEVITIPASRSSRSSLLHPVTRAYVRSHPERRVTRHYTIEERNPNNNASREWHFNLDFKWPEFPTYKLLDFYNLHKSYKAFQGYAAWKPQEAEIIDPTDMSARIGLRGAFEMLTKFEGKTEREMMNFHESWYYLVEQYSVRILTQEDNDKVQAIEGIAYFIGTKTKFNFVAGLWKEVLAFNLLWVVHEDILKPRPIRSQPTWSWASINGKISHWPKKRYQHSKPTQLTPLINRNTSSRPKETSPDSSETEWEQINILISNEEIQSVESSCILELTGHLVEFDHQKVIFSPDVDLQDKISGLFCLPILSLKSNYRCGFKQRYQLRGIVLQPASLGSVMFTRVGYFWTKSRSVETKVSGRARKRVQII